MHDHCSCLRPIICLHVYISAVGGVAVRYQALCRFIYQVYISKLFGNRPLHFRFNLHFWALIEYSMLVWNSVDVVVLPHPINKPCLEVTWTLINLCIWARAHLQIVQVSCCTLKDLSIQLRTSFMSPQRSQEGGAKRPVTLQLAESQTCACKYASLVNDVT